MAMYNSGLTLATILPLGAVLWSLLGSVWTGNAGPQTTKCTVAVVIVWEKKRCTSGKLTNTVDNAIGYEYAYIGKEAFGVVGNRLKKKLAVAYGVKESELIAIPYSSPINVLYAYEKEYLGWGDCKAIKYAVGNAKTEAELNKLLDQKKARIIARFDCN